MYKLKQKRPVQVQYQHEPVQYEQYKRLKQQHDRITIIPVSHIEHEQDFVNQQQKQQQQQSDDINDKLYDDNDNISSLYDENNSNDNFSSNSSIKTLNLAPDVNLDNDDSKNKSQNQLINIRYKQSIKEQHEQYKQQFFERQQHYNHSFDQDMKKKYVKEAWPGRHSSSSSSSSSTSISNSQLSTLTPTPAPTPTATLIPNFTDYESKNTNNFNVSSNKIAPNISLAPSTETATKRLQI